MTTAMCEGTERERAVGAVLVRRDGGVLLRGRAVVEPSRAGGAFWPDGGAGRTEVSLLEAAFLIVAGPWRWEITDARWQEDAEGARVEFRLPAVPVD